MNDPCRRSSGSYRAHFPDRESAESYAKDPANPAYHGDVVTPLPQCQRWHLSKPEWLVPDHQRTVRSVN